MLVPILGVTGLAVDYSVATNERAVLQDAADTAALAGASVFTGANAQAAEDLARAYLKADLGDKASTVTIDFKAANQKVSVTLGGQINTTFMRVLNQDKTDIAVNATALAPLLKPSSAKITIDQVTGYWFKKVSIIVERNGKEIVVGTIKYTATDHSLYGGRGGGKTNPDIDVPVTFDLGDYKNLYLKMEIKTDGCDIGYRNNSSDSRYVNCVATNKSAYANYNSTLTTDNEDTVNHLFVDGKQLPAGSEPPLKDLMNCDNKTHSHAWEDGGGWAAQDFFYKIIAACKSVDGENVRLTPFIAPRRN